MKKFLLVFLLFLFLPNVYGRIEVITQCYQICGTSNFDTGWTCVTRCDQTVVYIAEGDGGNNDVDNDENSGRGGGGDDTIYIQCDDNKDGLMDCWKDLTGSSRITHPFGENRANNCNFHTGMDIGTAQEGGKLPLFSATSGTVVGLGYQNGTGFFIRVKNNNGSYTLYCHLDGDECKGMPNTNLNIGDTVIAGQLIGTTDNSGNSHGSHLDIKFYFQGQVSFDEVYAQFPYSPIEENDVKYCAYLNRTYVNPEHILNSGDCQ